MTFNRLMRFDCQTTIVAFLGILALGLIGCTPKGAEQSSQSESRREVERLISELERSYEREDGVSFIRMVHDDYSGQFSSRGDLRSNLSDVFRSYQRIRLDFFGTSTTESDNTINARVNWNLQWTCQEAFNTDFNSDGDSDCASTNQVIRRSGQATLGFQQTDDGWKLIQQRGDIVFGDRDPGNVRYRSEP